LDFLGDKIELQGWKGFAGGLDIKSGTTGTHSLHRSYLDNEIMFHVSTMLPYSTNDPQQVERKRHLGNDIVLIVFLDGTTPYRPDTVSSHFIHIIIVIQPCEVRDGRVTKYRVEVVYKDTVSDFAPAIPDPPIFSKNVVFLDFLYAKSK
jgi:RAP1 GTPase activating protein 1